MWPFNRKQEIRAETVEFEDSLLQAILGSTGVTKTVAMQIPTVSSAVGLISEIVASTPIKLYRLIDGDVQEVKDDPRVTLLNDDTGDTLNSSQFWKAMVSDYFLGKGAYAYIKKEQGQFSSIHYVDESYVNVRVNKDHIFKDYDVVVDNITYKPFDFLKILRNSRDGASGTGIVAENSKMLEVAYESLIFESALVKKGGNKKGFLKSGKKLDSAAMENLKAAYKRLYGNNEENVVVLNDGIEFQETSNTSLEMQLNEQKKTNSEELGKIFHISPGVISGKASEDEMSGLAKLAAIPLFKIIECALNRDFLLEKEKKALFYWAFDTKELLKGNMKERFEAYKTAIDANFMQVDEVRYAEDLAPFGFTWIKLGLDAVLYDPKTKQIYTPNTNKTSSMGNAMLPGEEGTDAITTSDAKDAAEEVTGKTLNGAQTQSLITVVQQFQAGALTLAQAVNIISVSIGISRDEAAELIGQVKEGGE